MSASTGLAPPLDPARVTEDLCRPLLGRPGWRWWIGLAAALLLCAVGFGAVVYQMSVGIGTWGVDRSVGWAVDITSFVFWIGIGHAGTFISAILFLLRRPWRSRVSRTAEAATLLAVLCAGLFPLVHLGRPWLVYWMAPYPNSRGPLWVNFFSPLVWDFFAIGTYFLISLGFFYLGLVPDLAVMRARGIGRRLVWRLAVPWDQSDEAWRRYHTGYVALAGLASVLVISVHTVVSWDFAVSLVPGWHSPLFAPYFVVGAVYSGLAMVVLLVLVLRRALALRDYIGGDVLDRLCRLVACCSCFLALVYAVELRDWISHGNPAESYLAGQRLTGSLLPLFAVVAVTNGVLPQLFWFARVRRRAGVAGLLSALILAGMWLERYLIIVGSLERDYLPSSWTSYLPTAVEAMTLAGSVGLFLTGILLFSRLVPILPMHEVKAGLWQRKEEW